MFKNDIKKKKKLKVTTEQLTLDVRISIQTAKKAGLIQLEKSGDRMYFCSNFYVRII